MPPVRRLLAPVSLALALSCALGGAFDRALGGAFDGWAERAAAQGRTPSGSMRSGRRARASSGMRASSMRTSSRRGSSARSSSSRSSRRRGSRGRASRRRSAPRRASVAYRRQVVRWHRRPSPEAVAAWESQTPPPLVFRPVRYPGEYALVPDAAGAFSRYQLRAARKAFTYRDALSHDVHPALMERAYRIVREFRVPYLWLISGYRDTRSTSRHSQGRAMDVVAPGVSNAQLARFARTFGFTGVGEYSQSGFVHIDVRARSYFWVDRSAPGARSRERQVRRGEAQRVDRAARARGEQPVAEGAGLSDADEAEQAEESTGSADPTVTAGPTDPTGATEDADGAADAADASLTPR